MLINHTVAERKAKVSARQIPVMLVEVGLVLFPPMLLLELELELELVVVVELIINLSSSSSWSRPKMTGGLEMMKTPVMRQQPTLSL